MGRFCKVAATAPPGNGRAGIGGWRAKVLFEFCRFAATALLVPIVGFWLRTPFEGFCTAASTCGSVAVRWFCKSAATALRVNCWFAIASASSGRPFEQLGRFAATVLRLGSSLLGGSFWVVMDEFCDFAATVLRVSCWFAIVSFSSGRPFEQFGRFAATVLRLGGSLLCGSF